MDAVLGTSAYEWVSKPVFERRYRRYRESVISQAPEALTSGWIPQAHGTVLASRDQDRLVTHAAKCQRVNRPVPGQCMNSFCLSQVPYSYGCGSSGVMHCEEL